MKLDGYVSRIPNEHSIFRCCRFALVISQAQVSIARLLSTGFIFIWLRVNVLRCVCANIYLANIFLMYSVSSWEASVYRFVCARVCVCVCLRKPPSAYGCTDHVIYSGWLRTRMKFQPKFRCRSCFHPPYTQLWMRYIAAREIVLFLCCCYCCWFVCVCIPFFQHCVAEKKEQELLYHFIYFACEWNGFYISMRQWAMNGGKSHCVIILMGMVSIFLQKSLENVL